MSEETEYDFKRTGAQIETLLDKISAEGDVAKVYQTTLLLNSLEKRDNKAATKEEVDEVLNIIEKYKAGYIVTIVEDNDYPFHYGVVNVGMMDDAMPITLTHYNHVGDVMAYSLDAPAVGGLWTVTNKSENGVYITTLPIAEIISGEVTKIDKIQAAEIEKIKNLSSKNVIIKTRYYDRFNTPASIPLSFCVNSANGINILFSFGSYEGIYIYNIYTEELTKTNWSVSISRRFHSEKVIPLTPCPNTLNKTISFDINSLYSATWFILTLNFAVNINGTNCYCRASMPIRRDRNTYYSQAYVNYNPIIPVEITVTVSTILVKLITSNTITSFMLIRKVTYSIVDRLLL